jgi:hypothetical protein
LFHEGDEQACIDGFFDEFELTGPRLLMAVTIDRPCRLLGAVRTGICQTGE